MQTKQKYNKTSTLADAIAGVIFTTVFLILVNAFYKDISFLNDDFDQVLPLYNTSLIVAIVLHASRIIFRSKAYKIVTQIISNIFFIAIAYQLWTIFPFDTSVIGNQKTWDFIFKLLIVLPPIAVVIGTIVELVKLVSGAYEENDNETTSPSP